MWGRGRACVHVKHLEHADGGGMRAVLRFWKDMSRHQGGGGNTAVLGLSSARIAGVMCFRRDDGVPVTKISMSLISCSVTARLARWHHVMIKWRQV